MKYYYFNSHYFIYFLQYDLFSMLEMGVTDLPLQLEIVPLLHMCVRIVGLKQEGSELFV